MSMGKSGGVSRVTGRLWLSHDLQYRGSKLPRPGQIAINKLREVMDILS